MRLGRSALSIALAHPIYIAVYVVFLSFLGVMLTLGTSHTDDAGEAYEPERARIAVIDRDETALSFAFAGYLERTQEAVDVPDTASDLQGALATNLVDAVLVIPEDFESALLDAARLGGTLPSFQISFGGYAQASALAEQDAARWVALAGAAAALDPAADAEEVAHLAEAAAKSRAETDVADLALSNGPAYPLQAYLAFSTYTITCSVVVCAGLVFSRIGERRFRSRVLASPIRPRRLGLETLAACAVLTVGVWAVTGIVGVVASGAAFAGVSAAQIALALAAMAVFSLVPLSLAFLLAQLGFGENALNALGNLGGMVMAFLGGAWVPIAILGDAVQAAARFVPTYWTLDAVSAALSSPALSLETAARIGTDMGVTALFAIVVCAVAIAISSVRKRSS